MAAEKEQSLATALQQVHIGVRGQRVEYPKLQIHLHHMARPKFVPTRRAAGRRTVKAFAAYGIKQDGIARVLRFRSSKTLRKYFRQEGGLGEIEGVAQVAPDEFSEAEV